MIPQGQDGVTHVNIFSKGKTELGRLLTNFAHTPVWTEDGHFESIEGYWYWLSKQDGRLRTLVGWQAKRLGRTLPDKRALPMPEFRRRIELACRAKVQQHPYIRRLLQESSLPFTHYYEYDGRRIDAGFEWLANMWEQVRRELKEVDPDIADAFKQVMEVSNGHRLHDPL